MYFHARNHLAKQLKSAWIQTRKMKSKWNAERRKEGSQMESASTAPVLETADPNVSGIPAGHQPQPIDAGTGSDASPPKSEERPANAPSPRTIRGPVRTAKTGPAVGSSQQRDRRSGHPNGHHRKPSMRNRMNALLEKIQREID